MGKLIYLSNTRPDITFVVQQLSQFLDSPIGIHMSAVKHVPTYLKGIIGQCLFYAATSNCQLHVYSYED